MDVLEFLKARTASYQKRYADECPNDPAAHLPPEMDGKTLIAVTQAEINKLLPFSKEDYERNPLLRYGIFGLVKGDLIVYVCLWSSPITAIDLIESVLTERARSAEQGA
jgi:hypothetical protein